METLLDAMSENGLAATIAPEDLEPGDFVALVSVTCEYPSFFWCGDAALRACDEPVRVSYRGVGGGVPLKIKAICLPFVFVEDPTGNYQNLDTRLCRLVRLSTSYARKVRKSLRKKRVLKPTE